MKSLIICLIFLSSLKTWAQVMPIHLQEAFNQAMNKNSSLKHFYSDLNKKYDCHTNGDLVINCEISLKVTADNVVLMSYQYSQDILYQTFRSFHFIFNQGTQPYNEVVFTVDYKVETTHGNVQAEVVSFSEL